MEIILFTFHLWLFTSDVPSAQKAPIDIGADTWENLLSLLNYDKLWGKIAVGVLTGYVLNKNKPLTIEVKTYTEIQQILMLPNY